ncbi:hypothetical protein Tco_0002374 [Tanacetum coccineum]
MSDLEPKLTYPDPPPKFYNEFIRPNESGSISKPSHRGNKKSVVKLDNKSRVGKGMNNDGHGGRGEDLVDIEVKEAMYVEEQDANRNEEAKRAKVNDVEVPAVFNDGNSGNPGLANSGNNALNYVPVIVNEIGNKVVDMDPIMEEGTKK